MSRIIAAFVLCAVPCFGSDPVDFDRPTLGCVFVSMEAARQSVRDFPTKEGMVLLHSPKSSPLGRVGLNGLDVITHINKRKVRNDDDFDKAMESLKQGVAIEIVGYSPIDGEERLRWKKGTLKVTPVTLRQFIKDSVRIDHDKFKDITYYFHREQPEHENDDVSMYLYKSADAPLGAILRMNYNADDWLFVKSFSFVGGDVRFDIKPTLLTEVQRDNARGRVWEWYDAKLDDHLIDKLKTLAESSKPSMRYDGRTSKFDRTITMQEQQRLRVMLMAKLLFESE